MERCSFSKNSYEVFSPDNNKVIEKLTPNHFDFDANLEFALATAGAKGFKSPILEYGMDNLIDCINNHIYPALINRENPPDPLPTVYPHFDERLKTPEPLSPVELGDFLDSTSYEDVHELNHYIASNPQSVLYEFNNYYYKNYGGRTKNSLCSLLNNPFVNATGLIEMIINNSDNPTQFLPDAAKRLKAYAEQIKGFIQNLFKELNSTLNGLTSMANNSVKEFTNPNIISGLSTIFNKRDTAIRNMLSPENENDIKLSIDKMVTNAANQFKKLIENPQIILHLLFMFCKIQSSLEEQLRDPIESYRNLIGRVDTERHLLKIQSSVNTRLAVENGRLAVSESSRQTQAQETANRQNSAIQSSEPPLSDYQTQMADIKHYSSHPAPNSWSNLRFLDSVISNKTVARLAHVSPDIGYYGANLQLIEKLNEVGKMLGRTLHVNSAYRHPAYNRAIGGAKRSAHMRGIAFDVQQSKNREERARYVAMCKRAGFNGFGFYPTFIHADTAGSRSWVGSKWGGKW